MDQLFVYGTLRRGESNHGFLTGSIYFYRQAWVEGSLFDTGSGYPAASLDGAGRIYGEVYSVGPGTLMDLDALEGYSPGSQTNLYERVEVTVHTDQGPRQAMIYVYNQPTSHLTPIPSGDWRIYRQMKQRTDWLYFAYGSCMDMERITEAGMETHFQTVGVGTLRGYDLQFRRQSSTGGKADLVEGSGYVEGKLYRIDQQALDYLDIREGVRGGAYRPCLVTIQLDGRYVDDVLTYVVVRKSESEIAPQAEYVTEIIRGAKGLVSDAYFEYLLYRCCDRWRLPRPI